MSISREIIKPEEGSSISCLDLDMEEFDNPYHYHPEIEITWIVKSSGQRIIGDSIESFEPGNLALIGSNVPHQYMNLGKTRAVSKVVQFLPDVFGKDLLVKPEFFWMNDLFISAKRGIQFGEQTLKAVSSVMSQIFVVQEPWRKITLLIELLWLLHSSEDRKPVTSLAYQQSFSFPSIERAKKTINYLEQNWDRDITRDEIAKIANLHPHSVSRFFKTHIGITFQEFLIQHRIHQASQSLLESDRTILDIALSCGFKNLSNFNKQFKRIKATSPSLYRKQKYRRPG